MSGGKEKILVHKTEKETMISMLVTMLEGVGSIYIMYTVYLRPPYCCTHVIKHWTHLKIHQRQRRRYVNIFMTSQRNVVFHYCRARLLRN